MATINVDEATKDDLKAYCKKQNITQGDFAKFALGYFKKSGINPTDPPESVKEELAKIEKRISQLIGFQKTFERDNLLPLLEALGKTEGKINVYFAELPKKIDIVFEGVTQIHKATSKLEHSLNTALQRLFDEFAKTQGETRDIANRQHKAINEKLDIIIEHGAGVGGVVTSSIKDRNQKQKK